MTATSTAEAAYRSSAAKIEETIDERNALVMAELPQVYYIAARIRERLPQHVEMEDLVHAGVIGLIEACRNYDSAQPASFSTFAKFRVRGAILDSLRKLDWGSRSLRKKGRAIAEATARLSSALGRAPLQEEIAADLKMNIQELQSALTQLDGLYLMGQQADSADEASGHHDLIESAPSNGGDNPFDLCLEGEEKEHLKNAVLQLSEREQLILSLYYSEELTMREISEVVGVAVSRISQIHTATLAKLRVALQHLRETSPKPASPPQVARRSNHSLCDPSLAGRRSSHASNSIRLHA